MFFSPSQVRGSHPCLSSSASCGNLKPQPQLQSCLVLSHCQTPTLELQSHFGAPLPGHPHLGDTPFPKDWNAAYLTVNAPSNTTAKFHIHQDGCCTPGSQAPFPSWPGGTAAEPPLCPQVLACPTCGRRTSVLLSCGCCDQLPQTEWLKTRETYHLRVREDRRPKSRCGQGCAPPKALEDPFIASSRFWWLPACFGFWPHHPNLCFHLFHYLPLCVTSPSASLL